MFSGESNTPPFFRRLQQIWKTESITVAQPTGIPDSRWAAAYVYVNLACTSSIILQTRNTADAHPPIIRSPSYYLLTYVTNAVDRFMVGGSKINAKHIRTPWPTKSQARDKKRTPWLHKISGSRIKATPAKNQKAKPRKRSKSGSSASFKNIHMHC